MSSVHSDRSAEKAKQLNAAVFDRQAADYDTRGWGRFTLPLLHHVRQTIGPFAKGNLLDVGCGTGVLLAALADTPGLTISGVDISSAMIEVASARLGTRAELKLGDAENLPWPDQRFDLVVCSSSFHHYPQPRRALEEMRRILRPDGRLVLADFWLPAPWRQITNALILPISREGDVRIYSRAEVVAMLSACGFTVRNWRRIGLWNYLVEGVAG